MISSDHIVPPYGVLGNFISGVICLQAETL